MLGPFWITLSMAAMIGGIGYMYAGLFGQKLDEYIVYLAAGVIVFSLISSVVVDGTQVFITSARAILQTRAPISIYVYQMVWKNILIFGHNILIHLILLIALQVKVGAVLLLALAGLVIIIINSIWLALILGGLSARFRDVPPTVASLIQLAFFLTPIFWKPDQLPESTRNCRSEPTLLFRGGGTYAAHGPSSAGQHLVADPDYHLRRRSRRFVVFCEVSHAHSLLGMRRPMSRIRLDGVSVIFPIYSTANRSFKNVLISATTGGRLGSNRSNYVCVQALDRVSLDLRRGDKVGIIGHNGAGKTTLLRVMAGIFEPNEGSVAIEGRVTPMFDANLGIDPEGTGRENIILRGLYMGLSRADIFKRIESIVDFTELGDFVNLPVRTYSEGMQARLAFAIATCIEPEILVLDEGIGAGDAAFIAKANKRLAEYIASTGILVLASHSEELICKFCNKVVLMEHGRVLWTGDVHEGFQAVSKGHTHSNRTARAI